MDTISQIALTVISIFIVLGLESFRKPRLRFTIGTSGEIMPNDPAGRTPAKWTHVYVYNEPMPKWLSWIWDRNPALSCRGWISFHALDGQDLFGRKMEVRWANNPEPLLQDPGTGQPTGIDWDKMRVGHLWDIPPGSITDGDYGNLDIVFRSITDSDCYGWNNKSYLYGWRNPEWKLESGRYLAKIVIKTGGQTFSHTVQIMNQGRYEDFRLEPSSTML
jgi:hypothetical protein